VSAAVPLALLRAVCELPLSSALRDARVQHRGRRLPDARGPWQHRRRRPQVDVDGTRSPKPADEYARHVKEAAAEIAKTYPDWARSTGASLEPWGQHGEWTYKRGPPYVKKLTMFKGVGVDQVGVGTLIRRVLGLGTAAGRKCDLRSCDHAMTGNSYLNTFDGAQFRFLYRNWCSTIVIPPLRAAGPVLDARGLYRLHHWLTDGKNTLVVGGGDANIAFINGNCIGPDGGFSLEADKVRCGKPYWPQLDYRPCTICRAAYRFHVVTSAEYGCLTLARVQPNRWMGRSRRSRPSSTVRLSLCPPRLRGPTKRWLA